MSFLGTAWRVVQGVTSLGGTERIRYQQERSRDLLREYEVIRSCIGQENTTLIAATGKVRKQVRIARRTLKRAARFLRHVASEVNQSRAADTGNDIAIKSQALAPRDSGYINIDGDLATLAGVAAGTAAAASSWGLVQILGHASTGTAMAGLHGAAAANAGWAWFGGGSLAAGGGGMAAGHLVLPGIGTAVAVAVSSVLSHKEANKLSKACDEIEGVNTENQLTLTVLRSHVGGLRAFQNRLYSQSRLLEETVTPIYRRLLPFGILSDIWRIIRSWCTGNYFRPDELSDVQAVELAVERFLKEFS
jgi:hypothetical protein